MERLPAGGEQVVNFSVHQRFFGFSFWREGYATHTERGGAVRGCGCDLCSGESLWICTKEQHLAR